MRRTIKSYARQCWSGIFHVLSLCYFVRVSVSAVLLYSDGQSHSIKTSLNDFISLQSSSKLTLPSGGYAIRSPSGSECAIRLAMSSALNATGGQVFGADASQGHPAAAGVIVGSASSACFGEGVSVRGGNDQSADRYAISRGSPGSIQRVATQQVGGDNVRGHSGDALVSQHYGSSGSVKGHGGDALVSQYTGSNVTIQGGTFVAGRGSVKDGHSLLASYEAHIYVYGGSYYGSWMARDRGWIVVHGCLSRVGTRLVGRLQNGNSLDVQVLEEGAGKIILHTREACNSYRKSESSATKAMGKHYLPLFGMAITCLGLAFV